MATGWFFTQFPPSRFAIEAELRNSFWHSGYGHIWFTCIRDEPPYACLGLWNDREFHIEWEPKDCLTLTMPEPNDHLLTAFEKVLGHRALAAYKNGEGKVVVEWRVRDGDKRFQELEGSGVQELERLNK